MSIFSMVLLSIMVGVSAYYIIKIMRYSGAYRNKVIKAFKFADEYVPADGKRHHFVMETNDSTVSFWVTRTKTKIMIDGEEIETNIKSHTMRSSSFEVNPDTLKVEEPNKFTSQPLS